VTYVDRRDLAGLRAVLEVAELAQQWRDGLITLERRASS
jgi:3-alpha domain